MKRVLFICVQNSCRSQIAEAFVHIHGKGVLEATSAGSEPTAKVNQQAVATMQEINYDLSQHYPKSLQEISTNNYDIAITMGCGDRCPFVNVPQRQDWGIVDPKNFEAEKFRAVRKLIEKKVLKLIEEIKSGNNS
ncbi:MAG: arsenate reductase ArsC [Desulfotomaculum sp.]|nr:arsenate reductase ArsC [Desulfotomaculum sp.]